MLDSLILCFEEAKNRFLSVLFSPPSEIFVGPVFSRLHTAQRQQRSQESPPRKRRTRASTSPVGKSSASEDFVGNGSILGFVVAMFTVSNRVETFERLRGKNIFPYHVVARLT